jgi:NADP-dependent 3-hydroxy acid dehydrogenase YdfG
MDLLDGNIALVTGAATGIGRETAILLAQEGATVVVTGRRIAPLQDVVAVIEKADGKAVARARRGVAGRDSGGRRLGEKQCRADRHSRE